MARYLRTPEKAIFARTGGAGNPGYLAQGAFVGAAIMDSSLSCDLEKLGLGPLFALDLGYLAEINPELAIVEALDTGGGPLLAQGAAVSPATSPGSGFSDACDERALCITGSISVGEFADVDEKGTFWGWLEECMDGGTETALKS